MPGDDGMTVENSNQNKPAESKNESPLSKTSGDEEPRVQPPRVLKKSSKEDVDF